jgi:hypothetical protein
MLRSLHPQEDTPPLDLSHEQISVAVTLQIFILEVLGSNLDRDVVYSEFSRYFPQYF